MALNQIEEEILYQIDFSEKLTPIAWSEEDLYYISGDKKKGEQYLGFCFISSPIPGTNDTVRKKLSSIFTQDYPQGTVIHFSLFGSPDIEFYIDRMMSLRSDADDLLYNIIKERSDFIRDCSREAQSAVVKSLTRNFIFEVDVKVPIYGSGPDKKPTEDEIKNVKNLQISVGQALAGIGMNSKPAHPEQLIRYMSTMLNWGENASWRTDATLWDQNLEIRRQIKDHNVIVDVEKNYVKLGDKLVASLSPKKLPPEHYLFVMDRLVGDQLSKRGVNANFMLSLVVSYPDNVAKKKEISQKEGALKYQAFGPMVKWFPEIGRRLASFQVMSSALARGERCVEISPAIFVWDDNPDALRGSVSQLMTYYQEWGWSVQEDACIHGVQFINHLPFCADSGAKSFLGRYGTVATSHAVEFIPCAADWKGTGTPIVTLFSRNNQLMSFDTYDSSTNFGAVIAAASGSGKSFLTNDIIVSNLSVGANVYVIDVGKSYFNICQELGGSFIEFHEDSDVCLNPFSMIDDFSEESEMITSAIVAMAQENTALTDPQLAAIRRVITDIWEDHGKDSTVDMVAERLLSSEDQRFRDIGSQLFPFTSKGSFGRWFNGPANVDLTNRFTVLELEHLKSKPALQKVVLLMLISNIQNAMYLSGTEKRKLMIVDECWEFLGGDNQGVAKFLEGGYRKFRKVRGSPFIITQSVDDLYMSSSGKAIAQNSAFKILLGQTNEAVQSIKAEKRIAIGDYGYDLLSTVATVKGEYSEMFVYSTDGAGVGRLIVPPFSRILYSTDPADREAIRVRVEQQGMTTAEAIKDIVEYRKNQ